MSMVASSAVKGATGRSASGLFTVLLLGGSAMALFFWVFVAAPYLRFEQSTFGRFPDLYWPRRYPLIVHIAGGSVALLVGPIQLWLGETRRKLGWHRTLGWTYLGAVAISCSAAYYMALTSPVGWVFASGLFGLAVAWTLTTGMAYLAIARRVIEQHREWMIRSYVVTFAFVVFRIFAAVTESMGIGTPVERVSAAAWFCWAVPLAIAEPILQWRKQTRP
jgi:hypothetical protein